MQVLGSYSPLAHCWELSLHVRIRRWMGDVTGKVLCLFQRSWSSLDSVQLCVHRKQILFLVVLLLALAELLSDVVLSPNEHRLVQSVAGSRKH